MRCSSTVSAPVQHCCAPLTAHYGRYIAVQLLTNEVLYFVAETKSKAKDVYTRACIYLAGRGMQDCEIFGLAIMYDGEYLFVDPESKLSKYAPKNWKSSSSYGLDGHGKPTFTLHLRVQFYVDTPALLRDEMTRHNYYLQLRENTLTRGQMTACSSDELLFLLAGYALQADYGDYNERNHGADYFQIEKYFPKELITKNKHVFQTAIALHKDNRGLTAAEAELQYIREASSTDISFLPHNLHLYKLKTHKKQNADQSAVWLAICARGIHIYEETHFKKSASTTFSWNNIGKLCFDRKKFEIKALSPAGEKMTYYTNSDEKSKHLLLLCRVTHQFSMSVQAKLTEIKRQEGTFQRASPLSYAISIKVKHGALASSVKQVGSVLVGNSAESLPLYHSSGGGLSERMYHRGRTKRGEESGHERTRILPLPNGATVAGSTGIDYGKNSPISVEGQGNGVRRKSTGSSVELGLGPVPGPGPGPTDRSTIVFGSMSRPNPKCCLRNVCVKMSSEIKVIAAGKTGNAADSYETSISSNYGLKNSHGLKSKSRVSIASVANDVSNRVGNFKTADICKGKKQDDMVSSQENVDYSDLPQRHACNVSDLETSSSGVYTSSNDLNSENVNSIIPALSCTVESDLLTNVCSSETSEVIYDLNGLETQQKGKNDCLIHNAATSGRRRSVSNTSGESESESFCGDGSDRLDGGKRSLLTAVELSDLIVRKTHISGTYPSKATVSNTLDSDSDYVTLPLPPRYSRPSNEDFKSRRFSPFPNNSHFQSDKNDSKLQHHKKTNIPKPVFAPNGPASDSQDQTAKETSLNPPASSAVTTQQTDPEHRFLQPMPLHTCPLPLEEANARFVTTKPHVSMITHSNASSSSLVPNYACPTHTNVYLHPDSPAENHPPDSTACLDNPSPSTQQYSLTGHIFSNKNQDVSSVKTTERESCENNTLFAISFPSNKTTFNAPPLRCLAQFNAPSVPVFPVVGKNNYLDIHASKSHCGPSSRDSTLHRSFFTITPLTCIPPRSPPNAAPVTVYTSQVTSSQIEQFKQQLYSDVDYVVYPMKDPAISKQEYIDAKKCTLLAAMASAAASAYPQFYPPPAPLPPPYPRREPHLLYRSTPNVATDDVLVPTNSANSYLPKYPSQTNPDPFADHYPSSLLLDYPSRNFPNYLPRNSLSDIPGKSLTLADRTRSDDNILTSHRNPVCSFPRTFPSAPRDPLFTTIFSHRKYLDAIDAKVPRFTKALGKSPSAPSVANGGYKTPAQKNSSGPTQIPVKLEPSSAASGCFTQPSDAVAGDRGKMIDIRALIERSKTLDLPLISALCNDKSLLCQTNAFVMPKHPNCGPQHSPIRFPKNSKRSRKKNNMDQDFSSSDIPDPSLLTKPQKLVQAHEVPSRLPRSSKPCKGPNLFETIFSVKASKRYATSKLKYPVSGLSTSQISKCYKKKNCVHSAHVHPDNSDTDNNESSGGRPGKPYVKTSSAIISRRALVP